MSGNGGNPHSLRDLLGTYEKSGRCARLIWHVGGAGNALRGKAGQPPWPRVMAATGNRSGQALTGVVVGQVLSSENSRPWGADGMPVHGRQHWPRRKWQVPAGPHGVIDPEHAALYSMHGTWESPARIWWCG